MLQINHPPFSTGTHGTLPIERSSFSDYTGEGIFPHGEEEEYAVHKERVYEYIVKEFPLNMTDPALFIDPDTGHLVLADNHTRLLIIASFTCSPKPEIRLTRRHEPQANDNILQFGFSLWGPSKQGATMTLQVYIEGSHQPIAQDTFIVRAKITTVRLRTDSEDASTTSSWRQRRGRSISSKRSRKDGRRSSRRTPKWSSSSDDDDDDTQSSTSSHDFSEDQPSTKQRLTRAERYSRRNAAQTGESFFGLPLLTSQDVDEFFNLFLA